jgi:hypothetical protein
VSLRQSHLVRAAMVQPALEAEAFGLPSERWVQQALEVVASRLREMPRERKVRPVLVWVLLRYLVGPKTMLAQMVLEEEVSRPRQTHLELRGEQMLSQPLTHVETEATENLVQQVPEAEAVQLRPERWVQQAWEAVEVLQLKAGCAKARVEPGTFATSGPEPLVAALFWHYRQPDGYAQPNVSWHLP